ncbi:SDR family oxidoreductase [Gulosibacter macacae]|uniref:SDR family oxidoreductase n=1 Tax=Gulosibacter macacae TaxID=2488791 RepID=A0A3P3VWI9_9MICO|nr:SDR family oxidoreductase [Gulosibacter macacae]RRJ85986.1 SDR family oxidoreductase [Gulosibacter macacae]
MKPVALITGASSGIGRALVEELRATHEIVALGRDAGRLAELDAWRTLSADLQDAAVFEPGGAVFALVADLPRLDVIVHSAAVGTPWLLDATTAAEWQRQLATNVIAPALLTTLAMPKLREAHGTVVFIGSGVSIRPARAMGAYVASKHALKGLADTLRLEVEGDGVRVATVLPGQVATPMQVELQEGLGGTYSPEDYIRPESIATAVRYVVDAPVEVQITDLAVRPRGWQLR